MSLAKLCSNLKPNQHIKLSFFCPSPSLKFSDSWFWVPWDLHKSKILSLVLYPLFYFKLNIDIITLTILILLKAFSTFYRKMFITLSYLLRLDDDDDTGRKFWSKKSHFDKDFSLNDNAHTLNETELPHRIFYAFTTQWCICEELILVWSWIG